MNNQKLFYNLVKHALVNYSQLDNKIHCNMQCFMYTEFVNPFSYYSVSLSKLQFDITCPSRSLFGLKYPLGTDRATS